MPHGPSLAVRRKRRPGRAPACCAGKLSVKTLARFGPSGPPLSTWPLSFWPAPRLPGPPRKRHSQPLPPWPAPQKKLPAACSSPARPAKETPGQPLAAPAKGPLAAPWPAPQRKLPAACSSPARPAKETHGRLPATCSSLAHPGNDASSSWPGPATHPTPQPLASACPRAACVRARTRVPARATWLKFHARRACSRNVAQTHARARAQDYAGAGDRRELPCSSTSLALQSNAGACFCPPGWVFWSLMWVFWPAGLAFFGRRAGFSGCRACFFAWLRKVHFSHKNMARQRYVSGSSIGQRDGHRKIMENRRV